jgi:hypothetical protein
MRRLHGQEKVNQSRKLVLSKKAAPDRTERLFYADCLIKCIKQFYLGILIIKKRFERFRPSAGFSG